MGLPANISILPSIASDGSSVNVAAREDGAAARGIDAGAGAGAASGCVTAFRGKSGSKTIAIRTTAAAVNPMRVGVQNLFATGLWLRFGFGELMELSFPSIQ